jgi:hypothetical protein
MAKQTMLRMGFFSVFIIELSNEADIFVDLIEYVR